MNAVASAVLSVDQLTCVSGESLLFSLHGSSQDLCLPHHIVASAGHLKAASITTGRLRMG